MNQIIGGLIFVAMILMGCQSNASKTTSTMPELKSTSPYKISLAQWSLHRAIEAGETDVRDFAKVSKETYGIDAVEYVAGFYKDYKNDKAFWEDMKMRADEVGVASLLIMVDEEGDLGAADESERNQAVENHHAWVDAAKTLGCHSIRVNAFGDADPAIYKSSLIDGLKKLCTYADERGINILIENHGLFSSNGQLIAELIQSVDMPNLGTLPDFGNWCLSAKWGSTQGECDTVYDRYKGVRDFMPFAIGVSAKSYNFDEEGQDRIIDYRKMFDVVDAFDYQGYVGIEYEGVEVSEHEGIMKTKALLEKVWFE